MQHTFSDKYPVLLFVNLCTIYIKASLLIMLREIGAYVVLH